MLEISRISKLRKQIGFTQKQLADLSGVSQSLIAKIESGKIDPAYSKVIQILSALEGVQNRSKKMAADIMTSNILSVSPSDPLQKAISLMRSRNISQLPVLKDGKCIGSISDSLILDLLSDKTKNFKSINVGEVMRESFPVIPSKSIVDAVTDLLHHYSAVLVEKDGNLSGIITKADLFKAIG